MANPKTNWLGGDRDETLETLANLMREQGIGSLYVSETFPRGEARKVSLTLAGQVATSAVPVAPTTPLTSPPEHGAQSVTAQSGSDTEASQNAVPSPMVGTVYLAPEPGADSFVRTGSQVAEGDTLLIIEAMKVMNPLASPRSGTVTKVLVADGQPVEYGQPLVVIE